MLPPIENLEVQGFERVLRVDLGETVAFVALHRAVDGRSFGGVRVAEYANEDAALEDALALARAMSRKLKLADLPGGGAKTVVMLPVRNRPDVMRRLGAVIESLEGRYHCGGDFGFTTADDAAVRSQTAHIAADSSGACTAVTVRAAMEAATAPRSVAVQGLGDVGLPLALGLQKDGVRVLAADIRAVPPFKLVDRRTILESDVDVLAPCARGEVIDRALVERLRCRVVCGGANNPLAGEGVAEALAARGIVYVPDFLANVGAAVFGVCTVVGLAHEIPRRLAAVGPRTGQILDEAQRSGETPLTVALRRAE